MFLDVCISACICVEDREQPQMSFIRRGPHLISEAGLFTGLELNR